MVTVLGWFAVLALACLGAGALYLTARLSLRVLRDALTASWATRTAPAELVLGLSASSAAPSAPVTGRELWFRGALWREQSQEGLVVTFTREVAVDGRPAMDEVRVVATDLCAGPDGRYTLTGRS